MDTHHGHAVADPYRWLEDPRSAETLAWLRKREREFHEHAGRWPARRWLAAEIRALVAHDDWSAPRRRGGTLFATHREAGAEHPRLLAITSGRARVVFDPSAVDPEGRTTLDAWEVDPLGHLVAVQTSRDGTERGKLEVLSTGTGRAVEAPIHGVRYTHVVWLPPAPGREPGFYYVRRDDSDGRRGVWLHRLGAPQSTDVLVHPCRGARTVPGVRLERDRWLIVSESHGTGHREDLWLADLARTPPEAPELREIHVGSEVESEPRVGPDGMLYLRTTAGARRRRVCRVDPADPAPGNWREIIAEAPEATLDSFLLLDTGAGTGEILVARTRLGISELTTHDLDGGLLRRLPLPGEGMVARMEATSEPCEGTGEAGQDDTACTACISYADVSTRQRVLLYRPGGHGGSEHESPRPAGASSAPLAVWPPGTAPERPAPVHRHVTWCRSADGTAVPITVFSLRPFGEPGPTILHAYGAYGRPRQFGFSATVLAWLRAGGQYAVAHVRGGGDLGREWHLGGVRRRKSASVDDLVAAGEALVASGYCATGQLCLSGGSAGGLLVLAAVVRRPDLCAAVIASAPLADMVRFERMGLGAMWTREFGSVADPGDFAALLSYSPYHQVLARGRDRDYPPVLLTGFHGDTRTDAAHPRKMCAALLEVSSEVLLRYEYGVGHGPRAVTSAIELAADAHAFAAALTGLSPPARREVEEAQSWSEGR